MGAMCGKSERKPKQNFVPTKTGVIPVEKASFIVSDPSTPVKKNVGQNYNFENITSTKMRFGYSDVKGFTDSYTMLFRYLKLGFNDRYILNENFWRDEEATREGFVLPALPYVVDGETKVTGDDSVITYVCIKANREDLLGKNGKDIAQVRMFLGLLRDMKTEVLDVLLQTDMPAEYEKIHQKRIEPRLIRLNNFLQKMEGNGFLLGYPTVADFKLYEMVNALTHYNIKGYDQYLNLTNFLNFFENHFENQLKIVDERLTSRQPSAQKNETNRNDVRLF